MALLAGNIKGFRAIGSRTNGSQRGKMGTRTSGSRINRHQDRWVPKNGSGLGQGNNCLGSICPGPICPRIIYIILQQCVVFLDLATSSDGHDKPFGTKAITIIVNFKKVLGYTDN